MAAPRIIYGGDEAAAHLHLPVAQNLLHKVRMMAAASKSGVTGLSFAPTPDSFIYVLKVGDTEVINIFSAPPPGPAFTLGDFVAPPDFLSGLTRDARYTTRPVKAPNGKTIQQAELTGFIPTAETVISHKITGSGTHTSPRLAVKPWAAFNISDTYGWLSQYNIVIPSMYSGRMRKLVQVLLGYGRLRPSQISTVGADKVAQVKDGVQVRYDFRWHRTHIVTVAADGHLWLVEISINNGAIAMRLPMIPDTAKLKTSDRSSIAAAAKEFGGLPNGLDFPTGPTLTAAIAAGTILRLATADDLAPFYNMMPYSSAMGWSVNDAGTDAHNTGTYWGMDLVRRSAHYSLQIRIGALKTKLKPKEPIADGIARLYLVNEGKLYHPSLKNPPPIKFHEPLLGYLLSVEMLAGHDYGGSNADTSVAAIPLCLCPMHVCHTGEQLKVIWYFWDRAANDSSATITTDNYETCMYIGSWHSQTVYTSRACQPTFFSMDFDMRKIPDPLVSTTDSTSKDMGYWSYRSADDLGRTEMMQWGFTERYRHYRHTSNTVSGSFKFNRAAVIIPGGMRDGYVYADLTFSTGTSWSTSYSYNTLLDPNNYSSYRTFYYPPPVGQGCIVQYDYRIREVHHSDGDECSNALADWGGWMDMCEFMPMRNGPPLPLGTVTVGSTPYKETAKAWMVTNMDRGTFPLAVSNKTSNWTAKSPNEYGDGQILYANHSCFGEEHIAYDQAPSGGHTQVRIGSLFANQPDGEYNFMGVL